MDEFILAGLLFHVGAAATLALVSAVSGMIDMRRRKVTTDQRPFRGRVSVLSAQPGETAS